MYDFNETINKLCTKGKGILAADESINTMGKRLKNIDLENTFDNRTKWRSLISNCNGLEEYISGIILCEETLETKLDNEFIWQNLQNNGIVIGIKVDLGLVDMPGSSEKITKGLDTLEERCVKYYELGARFSKWRAVFSISNENPSDNLIEQNINLLCKYAHISLKCGLVPLIEPEILMDGNHSIERSYYLTKTIISRLYYKLNLHNVSIENTLLKPNMVRAGTNTNEVLETPDKIISKLTIQALKYSVPSIVKGIMFLSGGLNETHSSIILNDINNLSQDCPWYLSFSYGRALQSSALNIWGGKDENVERSQRKLLEVSKNNSLSTLGKFIY